MARGRLVRGDAKQRLQRAPAPVTRLQPTPGCARHPAHPHASPPSHPPHLRNVVAQDVEQAQQAGGRQPVPGPPAQQARQVQRRLVLAHAHHVRVRGAVPRVRRHPARARGQQVAAADLGPGGVCGGAEDGRQRGRSAARQVDQAGRGGWQAQQALGAGAGALPGVSWACIARPGGHPPVRMRSQRLPCDFSGGSCCVCSSRQHCEGAGGGAHGSRARVWARNRSGGGRRRCTRMPSTLAGTRQAPPPCLARTQQLLHECHTGPRPPAQRPLRAPAAAAAAACPAPGGPAARPGRQRARPGPARAAPRTRRRTAPGTRRPPGPATAPPEGRGGGRVQGGV